jgi:hypothetical protein
VPLSHCRQAEAATLLADHLVASLAEPARRKVVRR